MARLPQVGGDSNSWGTILNEFLQQSHNDDGTLKNGLIDTAQLKPAAITGPLLADNAVDETKLTTELQEKINEVPNQLEDAIYKQAIPRNDWASQVMDALGTLAPPINTPTISWSAGTTTGMSAPVEYRPSVCGTGSQTTNWNGRNDPVFRFFSGLFYTGNGANSDLALYGANKPGGAAQAASWPVVAEFNTSAGVNQLEVTLWGSPDPAFRLEVNGQPAVGDYILMGPSGLGNGKKALLTFPDARVRRIRLYFTGGSGFHSIRVPSGQSISKPTDAIRRGAIIGDSFINGAGSITDFPTGAGIFDTWALRVMKALGCNDIILAGIGATGFAAGNPTNHFEQRLPTVLSFSPDVLVTAGSINDGGAGTGVQTAAASFFAASASVPERYAVGVTRAGYEANHAALEAAATAADVTFVPMEGFFFGNGKVTAPTGNGNTDIFMIADGAHPTFAGHRALEQAIWLQLSALKSAS